MTRARNTALAEWLKEHGITVTGLADLLNGAIYDLTRSYGTVSERVVYRWLSGETAWPNTCQRVALQRVTGRTPIQLGFRPRGKTPNTPPSPEEDPVYRRAFTAAAIAAGASLAASAAATPRRLGYADVDRMNAKLAAVVSMDDRYGGTPELETHAAALADEALNMQQNGTASARVRSELYAVAAALTTSAMWAAIDGRRPADAQAHLNKAVTLAGLANSPAMQFRVWGHASSLYRQLGRHTDALAAAEASRNTLAARRDPLYAALALARLAVHHADNGNAREALRALDKAQESYGRIDPAAHRPPWMRFFDQAELDSLALFAHLRLGRWADAERHGHQCLAQLRPDLERNRALTHANLALAQIGQGDIEPALVSARAVPTEMAGRGRVKKLLGDFTTRLTALAPDSAEARAWADHRRAIAA